MALSLAAATGAEHLSAHKSSIRARIVNFFLAFVLAQSHFVAARLTLAIIIGKSSNYADYIIDSTEKNLYSVKPSASLAPLPCKETLHCSDIQHDAARPREFYYLRQKYPHFRYFEKELLMRIGDRGELHYMLTKKLSINNCERHSIRKVYMCLFESYPFFKNQGRNHNYGAVTLYLKDWKNYPTNVIDLTTGEIFTLNTGQQKPSSACVPTEAIRKCGSLVVWTREGNTYVAYEFHARVLMPFIEIKSDKSSELRIPINQHMKGSEITAEFSTISTAGEESDAPFRKIKIGIVIFVLGNDKSSYIARVNSKTCEAYESVIELRFEICPAHASWQTCGHLFLRKRNNVIEYSLREYFPKIFARCDKLSANFEMQVENEKILGFINLPKSSLFIEDIRYESMLSVRMQLKSPADNELLIIWDDNAKRLFALDFNECSIEEIIPQKQGLPKYCLRGNRNHNNCLPELKILQQNSNGIVLALDYAGQLKVAECNMKGENAYYADRAQEFGGKVEFGRYTTQITRLRILRPTQSLQIEIADFNPVVISYSQPKLFKQLPSERGSGNFIFQFIANLDKNFLVYQIVAVVSEKKSNRVSVGYAYMQSPTKWTILYQTPGIKNEVETLEYELSGGLVKISVNEFVPSRGKCAPNRCMNCLVNPRNSYFSPCKDAILCTDCADDPKLKRCPACKKKILSKNKIFLA